MQSGNQLLSSELRVLDALVPCGFASHINRISVGSRDYRAKTFEASDTHCIIFSLRPSRSERK
ncbi:hypothetical protein PsorP6_011450 [Peronosclerospora sorghi]|uniref:Uncharacterized protein n=1 Tax=Peronosclerospora sorghi TaxID=230839 RepID=A0ACC0WI96_9STRA|nr:hypothetical protein PsorP6_011450 [Peronosclerospora sorghi]